MTQSVERDGSRKIGWKTSRVTRFSKCLRARSKWKLKLKCKSQAAPARGALAVGFFFPTEKHEVRREIPYSLFRPHFSPWSCCWLKCQSRLAICNRSESYGHDRSFEVCIAENHRRELPDKRGVGEGTGTGADRREDEQRCNSVEGPKWRRLPGRDNAG